MVATISADVVRSSSLSAEDYLVLRDELAAFLGKLEKSCAGFWARIVRGDSVECFVPEYHGSLRIALLLKLYVKMLVGPMDCSDQLKKHGIRFSIGVAEEDYSSREKDLLRGPAINLSGRNLDAISKRDEFFSAFEIDRARREVNGFVDSFVSLLSDMTDAYSVKQAEVVFYKLQGMREIQIAERLGIRQSSVNIRSTGAGWNLLARAVEVFENLNFEKVCG